MDIEEFENELKGNSLKQRLRDIAIGQENVYISVPQLRREECLEFLQPLIDEEIVSPVNKTDCYYIRDISGFSAFCLKHDIEIDIIKYGAGENHYGMVRLKGAGIFIF